MTIRTLVATAWICALAGCGVRHSAPLADDPDAGLTVAPSDNAPPAEPKCLPSTCDSVTCGVCDGCVCGRCKPASGSGCCSGDSISPCGAYACTSTDSSAGTCKTSCSSAADCAASTASSTISCVAGACVSKWTALGHRCGAGADCVSGFCIDGVCCDGACKGTCEACNAAGNCKPTTTARTPCVGGTGSCAAVCDGVTGSKCSYPSGGACSPASCTTDSSGFGAASAAGSCDGSGGCGVSVTPCAPYKCDATACKTKCVAGGDCAPGSVCDVASGNCKPIAGLGKTCAGPSDCSGGLSCVEHVCCSAAVCPDGTCAFPGSEGVCKLNRGKACTADAYCTTGNCVDGVCCDTACTGECEACDGAVAGTCATISGVPHGKRKACPNGAGDPCQATSCDGSARDSCTKFASGNACGAQSCTSATLQPAGACDGAGTCKLPSATACGDYQCAGPACGTTCAADSDCTPGRICLSGKCGPPLSATCKDTHTLHSSAGDVDCSPFICQGNACLKTCATQTDCIGGFRCDTSVGQCAGAASGGTKSSGGCGLAAPGGGSIGVGLGLAALGVLARRRRR